MLATVLCDTLFISDEFGGTPMQFGTDALVLQSNENGRRLVVTFGEDAHAVANERLYELDLGADDCRDQPTERGLY